MITDEQSDRLESIKKRFIRQQQIAQTEHKRFVHFSKHYPGTLETRNCFTRWDIASSVLSKIAGEYTRLCDEILSFVMAQGDCGAVDKGTIP